MSWYLWYEVHEEGKTCQLQTLGTITKAPQLQPLVSTEANPHPSHQSPGLLSCDRD